MTIQELLTKIAQTDALPTFWRVQAQREIRLDGATVPYEHAEAVLEYRDDGLPQADPSGAHWAKLGKIETSEPLVHTRDWIDRILVDRDVPASVVLELQKALGSGARILELEELEVAEIPF
jgi:hypothetical protein